MTHPTDLNLLLIQSLQEQLQTKLPEHTFKLHIYDTTMIALYSNSSIIGIEYHINCGTIIFWYYRYQQQFDITHPHFPDNLLDCVTTKLTYHHWYDRIQVTNIIFSLLITIIIILAIIFL